MNKLMWLIKFLKKFSLTGKISLIIIILITLIAVFAPFVSPYPPDKSSGPALEQPQARHIMGTDDLGYDIWSQIAYGARISLIIGIGTALFASFGGGIIGIISAYKGGCLDKILMRIIDIMIVLPDLPLMIILAAFFGPSLINIILVLTFLSWIRPARIVRSQVLMLKEMEYIKSAKSYGAGSWYLLKNHFLPEIFPLLAVSMIRLSSKAIVAEAGLSFLGLGDPTSKSWGLIIHHASNFKGIYYTPFWKWWLLFPWLALLSLIISLAFISRELEDLYSLKR
ncbi:MAG: ABC transporter permease [Halanaerobium sp.]